MKKKLVMIQPNTHMVYWGWYKYLDENYDFHLIVPEGSGTIHFLKNKIIYLEKYKKIDNFLMKTGMGYFIILKEISKILASIKPDIILSKIYHQIYSIESLNYAKDNNCKFYIVEEQKAMPINKISKILFYPYLFYLRSKFKYVKFISVTKDSSEFIKKIGFKSVYIPISYWNNEYKKIIHKQDKIRLLFVGRLTKVKNIEFVLYAINYLIKNNLLKKSEIEFLIVGEGELKNKLENLSSKLDLSNIVIFTGFIKNEELINVFKNSNIFILPSSNEAVGLVTLEAMFYSMPILCSKKAGSYFYVKHGYNGFIFSPNNLEQLAKQILILKNKNKRKFFGENSYNLIKTEFDRNIVGNKIDKIIK